AAAVGIAVLANPIPPSSAEHEELRAHLQGFAASTTISSALVELDGGASPLLSADQRVAGSWGHDPAFIELWFHVPDGSGDCLVLRWTAAGHQVDGDIGC